MDLEECFAETMMMILLSVIRKTENLFSNLIYYIKIVLLLAREKFKVSRVESESDLIPKNFINKLLATKMVAVKTVQTPASQQQYY